MIDDTKSLTEVIESHPAGTFKMYKGYGTGVEKDIHGHIENMNNVQIIIENALKNHCYIEVISLRLQIMDYWLRIYFINKLSGNEQRKREFGALLEQCKLLGLDNSLFLQIKEFNDNRIKAIHGFIIGSIKYGVLEKIAINAGNSLIKLILFVIDDCGEVITKLEGMNYKGDVIFNIPAVKSYYQDMLNKG